MKDIVRLAPSQVKQAIGMLARKLERRLWKQVTVTIA